MSKIFFPLRTNSAWFTKENTVHALEARIKTCLMLYDEIVIQDGSYQYTVWDGGYMAMALIPDEISYDRSKIKYYIPGYDEHIYIGSEGKAISVQSLPIKPKASYHVDFHPILNHAGLLNTDYIILKPIKIPRDHLKRIDKVVSKHIGTPELSAILGKDQSFQQHLFESLIIDSLLSRYLESPAIMDKNLGPLIKWNNKEIIKLHEGVVKEIFFDNWIKLGLPDFSQASWENIKILRTSSAGIEFRKMITRIIDEITQEFSNIADINDISIIVERNFTKELITELISSLPSTRKVLMNIGLNLLPFGTGTIVTGVKDVFELSLAKRSWVSLLQ